MIFKIQKMSFDVQINVQTCFKYEIKIIDSIAIKRHNLTISYDKFHLIRKTSKKADQVMRTNSKKYRQIW